MGNLSGVWIKPSYLDVFKLFAISLSLNLTCFNKCCGKLKPGEIVQFYLFINLGKNQAKAWYSYLTANCPTVHTVGLYKWHF